MVKKHKNTDKYFIGAQTCDSRKCRKDYKHELNDMCDAITTPQKIYPVLRKATCLYCGKTFKF
jgi:hypothetical protein